MSYGRIVRLGMSVVGVWIGVEEVVYVEVLGRKKNGSYEDLEV